MTNPDELLRLAERVEQGSGEDRELDIAILRSFNPDHEMFEAISPDTSVTFTDIGREWKWNAFYTNGGFSIPFPKTTSSLDAVEALRQRLLPRVREYLVAWRSGFWEVNLRTEGWHRSSALTEPRARLAALLRAVAGKEASHA